MKRLHSMSPRSRMRGITLIELMIALLLGLLVVGAAVGIFLSNRRAYTATESLGRVQENVRTSFELMSRDVREANGNLCNSATNNMAMVNVVNTPAANWWKNWGNGSNAGALVGFSGATSFPDRAFGTAEAERVAGTDALVVLSGGDTAVTVTGHSPASAEFTVSTNDHGFTPGTLLMVCGPNGNTTLRSGAIFGMTGAAGSTTIGHAAGGGGVGNQTSNLGLNGAQYTFGPNAVISRLHSSRWYIGNNSRGGRSLYQGVLAPGGVINDQEVAEGVRDLSLTYLIRGANAYVDADAVGANWGNVTAVNISVALEGQENVGTDGNTLRRDLMHVATLRNRNP